MTCSLEKGFPDGSMVKNPPANAWDAGLIVEVWEGPLEEEMTTHSSVLAWEIPWTEEPGGLESMLSRRVGHNWACTHAVSREFGVLWPNGFVFVNGNLQEGTLLLFYFIFFNFILFLNFT